MRRLSTLTLAMAIIASTAQAQVPFNACRDRSNRVIPGVVDNTMLYAGMATMQDGHPVILWNAHGNDRLSGAATLDTLVVEAQDSFAGRRGRMLDSTSTPPVFESLLDVPGTYDCEIVGGAMRCMVFAARKDAAAAKRYRQLVKILQAWLPSGWTSAEQTGDDGTSHTFLAQDGVTGALITWACTGPRVYLLVKRAPV